jgi:predicted nucleotidyltransferase
MPQYNWANCPPAVRAQVETFACGIEGLLGEDLVGLYLHGSLAMGCFNPDRSDIDLLGVTRNPMPIAARRALAEFVLRSSLVPRPIEISFLCQGDLVPWRHPTPFEFHYSETWRERIGKELENGAWQRWDENKACDDDLAAHLTIARHRGVCLSGAPIEQALPVVPPRDYRASIVGDFCWALERVALDPAYLVLNACRVYAYLRAAKICSKEEGGTWALAVLPPEHHALIVEALDQYRGDGEGRGFAPEALRRFIAYMERQIAGEGGNG